MSRKVGEQERGRGGREGKEEKGRQRREGREGKAERGKAEKGWYSTERESRRREKRAGVNKKPFAWPFQEITNIVFANICARVVCVKH